MLSLETWLVTVVTDSMTARSGSTSPMSGITNVAEPLPLWTTVTVSGLPTRLSSRDTLSPSWSRVSWSIVTWRIVCVWDWNALAGPTPTKWATSGAAGSSASVITASSSEGKATEYSSGRRSLPPLWASRTITCTAGVPRLWAIAWTAPETIAAVTACCDPVRTCE